MFEKLSTKMFHLVNMQSAAVRLRCKAPDPDMFTDTATASTTATDTAGGCDSSPPRQRESRSIKNCPPKSHVTAAEEREKQQQEMVHPNSICPAVLCAVC